MSLQSADKCLKVSLFLFVPILTLDISPLDSIINNLKKSSDSLTISMVEKEKTDAEKAALRKQYD